MRRIARFSFYLTLASAATVIAIRSGVVHDYYSYLRYWSDFWNHGITWYDDTNLLYPTANPYGPAFLLFAPLASIHYLAPKLLTAYSWIGVIALFDRANLQNRRLCLSLMSLLPFFWVEAAWYGHFDIMTVSICLVALLFKERRYSVSSGIALGIAILIKLIPVIFLPFLVVERKGMDRRFLAGVVFTIVLGFGFGAFISDDPSSIRFPFEQIFEREAKLFSIFNFLQSDYFPWQGSYSFLSLPLLFLGGAFVFWIYYREGLSSRTGCALVAFVFCIFNKVGHVQYFAYPLVFLILYLGNVKQIRLSWLVFMAWISAVAVLYPWTGEFRQGLWPIMREVGGLPSFLISIWVFRDLVKDCFDRMGSLQTSRSAV